MSEQQNPSLSRAKRKRPDSAADINSLDNDSTHLSSESNNNNYSNNTAHVNDNEDDETKWSEEIHRAFVTAIYDAGVSQSSPSVILENMVHRPASLTSERVKSHLQKYRKNKEKSKEEFLQDYDSFMRKAVTVGSAGSCVGGVNGGASHVIMPPAAMMEMMGGGKPSGGDIAAFLSYSVMTEGEAKNTSSGGTSMSPIGIQKESQDYLKNFAGTHLPFPQLTEEEKHSPLGVSMVYVMGLFSSLSQHMMNERRSQMNSGTTTSSSSSGSEDQLMVTATSSMPPPPNKHTTNATANPNAINMVNHTTIMNGEYTSPQQQPAEHSIDTSNSNNNNVSEEYLQPQAAGGLSQQQIIQLQQQQQSYWRNNNPQQLYNNDTFPTDGGGFGAGVNIINQNSNGMMGTSTASKNPAAVGTLEGTNWGGLQQSAGPAAVESAEPLSQSPPPQMMTSKGVVGARRNSTGKPGSFAQV